MAKLVDADIHSFKITSMGACTNAKAFLVIQLKDSGAVQGSSYGDTVFLGRTWRDDVEKCNVITVEIPVKEE